MSKHFSKTEFEYPVHRICGKIGRRSKVIHSCTASGKQITYLQGERDLMAHPVTQAELDRRTTFKTRQALVAARTRFAAVQAMVKTRKLDGTKRAQDQANFKAQSAYKTMTQYLWHVCGLEYDASLEAGE